jgi:CHAD domain-containing protein
MRSPGAAFDLRASLTEELAAALSELNGSPSRKAVHRCRVRLKRARALARVGRACAPGLSKVFNDSARAIMRALAQARDLAALADAARDVARDSGKRSAQALDHAAEVLDVARRQLPPLDIEATRAGIRDLRALAQVWPEASYRQIRRGAERVARRARRARRRGCGASEVARRHEWRKREKDRLYAALLLGEHWPEKRRTRRKKSEALGNVLGKERDALLLIERLERNPALGGEYAARALRVLRQRSRKLAAKADDLGAALHANGA